MLSSVRAPFVRCISRVSRRAQSSSKESQQAREDMYHQLKNTLEKPRPSAVMDQIRNNPERKARYTQSLWNMAASFMLILTAAQGVRASYFRKAAIEKQEEYEKELAELRNACKSLLDPKEMEVLAQQLSEATAPKEQSSWLSRGSSQPAADPGAIASLLESYIKSKIGDLAWTQAELDEMHVEQLKVVASNEVDDLLQEIVQTNERGEAVIQKPVFRI